MLCVWQLLKDHVLNAADLNVVHDALEAGVGGAVPPARIELPHGRQHAGGQLAVLHSLSSRDVYLMPENLEATFCLDDNGQPDPQVARVQASAHGERALTHDTSAV